MMRFLDSEKYSRHFVLSISLHALIILFLTVNLVFSREQLPQAVKSTEVVKATVLDEKQIQKEMTRIQEQRQEVQQAELDKQKKLQQQAEQLKQARIQEQKRLADAKAEMQKQAKLQADQMKQQQAALQKLKDQQQQEQKKLADIKKEQAKKPPVKQAAVTPTQEKPKPVQNALAEKATQEQQALALKVQEAVGQYTPLIQQAIAKNWLISPSDLNRNLSCVLRIELGLGGTVQNVTIIRGSGDPSLDRSARLAVFKSSPLPVPSAPDVFEKFRVLDLTVRPEKLLS